jgi:cytochrome o ubiquinol oxidase subunit II
MNRQYLFLPCIAVLLVAGVALFAHFHGATIPILEPSGPVALGERWVIIVTLLLCAIIVIPVFLLLFYFAWKYRADSPRASIHHRPDWDHDSKLEEFLWWLAPTAIIAILGVIMWQSAHQLDPYRPLQSANAPLTVDVVALDWKWLFIYPAQGIASVNLLEIPQDVPVHFYLTADAPMNSFWIPSLGGQIMVMPGMQTQLNLMASKEGTFNGFSGNISGDGFSGMAFTAKAVSPDDFNAWVAAAQASSTPLTTSVYSVLALPSEYNPVAYYSAPNGDLFTSIIMQYMTPAPSGTSTMMAMPAANNAPMSMPMNMPMDTMPSP